MTVLPTFGRALSKQLITRAAGLSPSYLTSGLILRVAPAQTSFRPHHYVSVESKILSLLRTYATNAAGPSSRAPKPRSKPAAKKTTSKKTSSKKRKTAKKPAKKSKAKPKRKELTEAQLARLAKRKENKAKKEAIAKRKSLKETSLLGKEPKNLPATAWSVVTVETVKGSRGGSVTEKFKAASQRYKSLSPEELERYNQIANQNRSANSAAYTKWVTSHTPAEILAANNARRQLAIQSRKAAHNNHLQYKLIKDERLVQRPRNAYSYFLQERFRSGDLKGLQIGEAGRLIAREWKELSNSEKKEFNDRAAGEKVRYNTEYKTVYGEDPQKLKTNRQRKA